MVTKGLKLQMNVNFSPTTNKQTNVFLEYNTWSIVQCFVSIHCTCMKEFLPLCPTEVDMMVSKWFRFWAYCLFKYYALALQSYCAVWELGYCVTCVNKPCVCAGVRWLQTPYWNRLSPVHAAGLCLLCSSGIRVCSSVTFDPVLLK